MLLDRGHGNIGFCNAACINVEFILRSVVCCKVINLNSPVSSICNLKGTERRGNYKM